MLACVGGLPAASLSRPPSSRVKVRRSFLRRSQCQGVRSPCPGSVSSWFCAHAWYVGCCVWICWQVGGGPGGYVAAIKAGQLGLKVCACDARPWFARGVPTARRPCITLDGLFRMPCPDRLHAHCKLFPPPPVGGSADRLRGVPGLPWWHVPERGVHPLQGPAACHPPV